MHLTVIDAASNLGLRPGPGGIVSSVHEAPAAIRATGLIDDLTRTGIEVADAGAVRAIPYDVEAWGSGTGPYHLDGVQAFTQELADRLGAMSTGSITEKVLVLGGDCSVVLGPLLALRRRGEPGLIYIDAHSDFSHPGNSPKVDALAGEDLAIATGRGGHALTDLEGLGPLVRDEQVALLGLRDHEDDPAELPFLVTDDIDAALAHITADDIWVHVDADVLDPGHLPAVDSPEAGGWHPEQLVAALRAALADPRVRGLDLCIYDPALDAEGLPGARLLAEILVASLGYSDEAPEIGGASGGG